MPKPVWEGLAHLDATERLVRAGAWVQPSYRTAQPVEVQPVAAPTEVFPVIRIPKMPQPNFKGGSLFDFDALEASLKELKF